MKIKYALIILLSIVICISCFGCNEVTDAGDATVGNSDVTTSGETEEVKYVYRTKYVQVEFVSDEQKTEWKNALVSLLNNEKIPNYNSDGSVEYSSLYPDRPCIERGYQLALFDINTDGVPELLVDVGGGSAGNAFYYVYDIVSGKELGTLDGGHDNSWCIYFNQSTGKFEAIGQFEWRGGWSVKMRLVNKATLTNATDSDGACLNETSWMYAYYNEELEHAQEEKRAEVEFRVYEESASMEEYFAAQDDFTENYIRIAETGIKLIDWNDVTSDGDDVALKAEKMATALIAANQKFIAPSQENAVND